MSEVSQVCKVLIKLTPKDYITDLAFPPEIIKEAAGEADHAQLNANNIITDANKQDLKRHWGEKIAVATANFTMVQILMEGLEPDIRNEMIKTSWLSVAQAFD